MAGPNRRPGWVGRRVALRRPGVGEDADTVAEVWLDEAGRVAASAAHLLEQWQREGIVGRASQGRLYPRDGQKFMDELPYMYKSPYLWAEPIRA
jgi:hypothetical protein